MPVDLPGYGLVFFKVGKFFTPVSPQAAPNSVEFRDILNYNSLLSTIPVISVEELHLKYIQIENIIEILASAFAWNDFFGRITALVSNLITTQDSDILALFETEVAQLEGVKLGVYVSILPSGELLLNRFPADNERPPTLKPGQGVGGWVSRERKPLVIKETWKDPRALFFEKYFPNYHSLACYPVIANDITVGLLYALAAEEKEFTGPELRFLDILAKLLGLVLLSSGSSDILKFEARVLSSSKLILNLFNAYSFAEALNLMGNIIVNLLSLDYFLVELQDRVSADYKSYYEGGLDPKGIKLFVNLGELAAPEINGRFSQEPTIYSSVLPFSTGGSKGRLVVYQFNHPLSEEKVQVLEMAANFINIAMQSMISANPELNLEEGLKPLLTALEIKDPNLWNHSKRIDVYTRLFAGELGLDAQLTTEISRLALVHDIGVLALNNPEEEYSDEHVLHGYAIISTLKGFEHLADQVLYHHENFNGTGYPNGLKRGKIPLGSRIIRICESFDSLVTPKDLKLAISPQAALEKIVTGARTGRYSLV